MATEANTIREWCTTEGRARKMLAAQRRSLAVARSEREYADIHAKMFAGNVDEVKRIMFEEGWVE